MIQKLEYFTVELDKEELGVLKLTDKALYDKINEIIDWINDHDRKEEIKQVLRKELED